MSDNKWISVKYRLPAERSKVLVFLASGDQCAGEYCSVHGFTNNVTHWQPLPEPPSPPDPFETWWNTSKTVKGNNYIHYIERAFDDPIIKDFSEVDKQAAYTIWNAALASVRK